MHLGRIVKCTLEDTGEPELHIAFRDKVYRSIPTVCVPI